VCRVKKGDFVWVFLDRSRKVGAELGVGESNLASSRKEWARVSVDDLMMVRGSIIIPHVSPLLCVLKGILIML
jgi:protein FAM50